MATTDIKYLHKNKVKDGFSWDYRPPLKAIRDGVIKPARWSDGRTARVEAKRLNKILEDWRAGKTVNNLRPDSLLKYVITHYLHTKHFDTLAPRSKVAYKEWFSKISATKIGAKTLGDTPLDQFTAKLCSKIYEEWATNTSVAQANTLARMFSVLMSYGMSLDLCVRNPMSKVKKGKHTVIQKVWTKEQVSKFLDVAFSKWEYRNIGLMVYMAYEWAQRPVDIKNLKWSNIDFGKKMVTIKQQKRGAEVYLPLYDTLENMLLNQQKDWGFQEYVIPNHNTTDGVYRPYTLQGSAYLVNKVLAEAGLPADLTAGILRKTAILEMVEANVDILTIKPVTGHKSLASLNPYMVNTLKAATTALDKRKAN